MWDIHGNRSRKQFFVEVAQNAELHKNPEPLEQPPFTSGSYFAKTSEPLLLSILQINSDSRNSTDC